MVPKLGFNSNLSKLSFTIVPSGTVMSQSQLEPGSCGLCRVPYEPLKARLLLWMFPVKHISLLGTTKKYTHFTSSVQSNTSVHLTGSEDDFRSGCRNVSRQQQFFSERNTDPTIQARSLTPKKN